MAYKRKVQYYETDKMSIVHHSNYIRWFEEARTEYMLENGINYDNVEKNEGVMMPVLEINCKYKQGAKYNDIVNIETSIAEFNGVKLVFEYIVTDSDKNILVTGSSVHCFVDMEFKPLRINKTHTKLYDKLKALTK